MLGSVVKQLEDVIDVQEKGPASSLVQSVVDQAFKLLRQDVLQYQQLQKSFEALQQINTSLEESRADKDDELSRIQRERDDLQTSNENANLQIEKLNAHCQSLSERPIVNPFIMNQLQQAQSESKHLQERIDILMADLSCLQQVKVSNEESMAAMKVEIGNSRVS